MLVGTKADRNGRRVVSTGEYAAVCFLLNRDCAERGRALANQLGIRFIETSAKDDINVTEAFLMLTAQVRRRLIDGGDPCAYYPAIHEQLSDIAIAMAPLDLPAYVLMFILDELPEFRSEFLDFAFVCMTLTPTERPEYLKIRLLQGIVNARRRVFQRRLRRASSVLALPTVGVVHARFFTRAL
jgi:hypothetical protein